MGINYRYYDYIQNSPRWKRCREICYETAGGCCQRCKWRHCSATHHLTYATLYCEGSPDGDPNKIDPKQLAKEVQCLCFGCHAFLHGLGPDPMLQDPRGEA